MRTLILVYIVTILYGMRKLLLGQNILQKKVHHDWGNSSDIIYVRGRNIFLWHSTIYIHNHTRMVPDNVVHYQGSLMKRIMATIAQLIRYRTPKIDEWF